MQIPAYDLPFIRPVNKTSRKWKVMYDNTPCQLSNMMENFQWKYNTLLIRIPFCEREKNLKS